MLLSLGFEIPKPPRRAGSANSCLSLSLGAFWLVRFGIKIVLIVSSSGLIRSLSVRVSVCPCSVWLTW